MGVFIALWCGAIVYRLVDLQIVRSEEIQRTAQELHHTLEPIPAQRGEILDAKGKLLGINQKEPYVFVDPMKLTEPSKTVRALGEILGRNRAWRRDKLATIKQYAAKKRIYCRLERRISETAAIEIQKLDLPGVYIRREVWRKYPLGKTASHLIGFLSQNGETMEGLEFSLDKAMRGTPGQREVIRDGKRRRIGSEGRVVRKPSIGSSVQLTIDANLQYFVENALMSALETTRARNATAIVMNPRTGAILALANMPDFDPNAFNVYGPFERKNRSIVDVYEPASAFKIITAAAALDVNVVNADQRFYCERGGIRVFDRYIRDNKSFDTLSVREILWHSSNVGAIKIAQRMKPKTFHDYIRRFGFGARTGVDLPAETPGIFRKFADWDKVSPAFLSMGHEISVTPLQMLTAACVIANEGKRPRPYLVSRILHPDGSLEARVPDLAAQPQVIRAETAALLKEVLKGVTQHGTAKAARLPGVEVFGKTGTAQRLHDGKYARDKFNASFVGFFPADQPRYGMIVVIHHPKGAKVDGGAVAAPVFAEIGRRILLYERAAAPENQLYVSQETPNWPSKQPEAASPQGAMPDFRGLGLRNLLFQCQLMGIKLKISGDGRVVRQSPEPGAPIPGDRVCTFSLEEG